MVCEALQSPRGSGGKGRGAHTPNNFTPPNPFKALPGAIAALGAGMPPSRTPHAPERLSATQWGWIRGERGERGGGAAPGCPAEVPLQLPPHHPGCGEAPALALQREGV